MKTPSRLVAKLLQPYLDLGIGAGGVVNQARPPQPWDFGAGGLDSPIYVNALSGEVFIYVNGSITPLTTNNAKAGGAQGNFVNDDTQPLQKAIDGTPIGGALFFPPGSYRITAPLNITKKISIFAYPGSNTVIYVSTPNVYGIIIGDGTVATDTQVQGTVIENITVAVAPGTAVSTIDAAILATRANAFQLRNVTFYGLDGGVAKFSSGLSIDRCLEWTVDHCYFYGCSANGIVGAGANAPADLCTDGRIDFCEFVSCGDAIFLGSYTSAITITNPIVYSGTGYAVHINCPPTPGAGFNYFITVPDLEVTVTTGALGGVYVQNGSNVQVTGGWIGGRNGLKVDSTASTVSASQTQFSVSGLNLVPIVIAGPACSLIGCDIVGDAVLTSTGISVAGTASDFNVIGGRIRQWTTAAIAYSGNALRANVTGVTFTSNTGANITGDGNASPGQKCRNCSDDGNTLLTAAATLPVRHGQTFVQATGATAITAIAVIGVESILVLQAGAGGITVNNSVGNLKGGVNASVPQFQTLTLQCTGSNWQEIARSF